MAVSADHVSVPVPHALLPVRLARVILVENEAGDEQYWVVAAQLRDLGVRAAHVNAMLALLAAVRVLYTAVPMSS